LKPAAEVEFVDEIGSLQERVCLIGEASNLVWQKDSSTNKESIILKGLLLIGRKPKACSRTPGCYNHVFPFK
jgi:hypothetical protein